MEKDGRFFFRPSLAQEIALQKTATLGKLSLPKDYAHRQQFAGTLPQRSHESGYTCTSITAVVTSEVCLEFQYCCRGTLGTTPVTFSGTFLSKCVATVCQTALTDRRFKFPTQNRSKLPYIRQLSTFATPNEHMQRPWMEEGVLQRHFFSVQLPSSAD
ncbi:unnamed protein product [Ixodes pacificus]